MPVYYNGELITLASGAPVDDATTGSWEIRGDSIVDLYLTEFDQTDPAGRFRLRVTGDELLLQRADLATDGVSTVPDKVGLPQARRTQRYVTHLTIKSTGPYITIGGIDVNLAELALEVDQLREYLQLVVGYIPPAGAESIPNIVS